MDSRDSLLVSSRIASDGPNFRQYLEVRVVTTARFREWILNGLIKDYFEERSEEIGRTAHNRRSERLALNARFNNCPNGWFKKLIHLINDYLSVPRRGGFLLNCVPE